MPHPLAPHSGQGDFDAAAIADDAPMLDALVLSAGAFPVLNRSENAFAEQAAFLRLKSPVIDGLRVFYFPLGPGTNRFRGGHGDSDVFDLVDLIQSEQFTRGFFGNHISFSWRAGPPSKLSVIRGWSKQWPASAGRAGWNTRLSHPCRGTAFPSPAR